MAAVEQQQQVGALSVFYEALKEQAALTKGFVSRAANSAKSKAANASCDVQKIVADRSFRVVTVVSAAGGLVLGSAGAAAGMVVGGTVGAASGVLASLFTFGLSIPAGAAIGGAAGASVGAVGGSTAGVLSGAATGYGLDLNRDRLAAAASCIQLQAEKCMDRANDRVIVPVKKRTNKAAATVVARASKLKSDALTTADRAKAKAAAVGSQAKAAAHEPRVQVTAAASAGGAIFVGVGGGAVGVTVGGFFGAAVGLIPALFTFGISIPIGAFMGSGAGLCVGTACGGSVGAIGGGAAGYGAYTNRHEIRAGADAAAVKVTQCKDVVQRKVEESAEFVRLRAVDSAHYVQQKVRGTTGGTA